MPLIWPVACANAARAGSVATSASSIRSRERRAIEDLRNRERRALSEPDPGAACQRRGGDGATLRDRLPGDVAACRKPAGGLGPRLDSDSLGSLRADDSTSRHPTGAAPSPPCGWPLRSKSTACSTKRCGASATAADRFVQADPLEGQPATRVHRGSCRLRRRLPVHRRAVPRQPIRPGIVVNDIRKDFVGAEQDIFEVLLDTFADRRNGFIFATNAGGSPRRQPDRQRRPRRQPELGRRVVGGRPRRAAKAGPPSSAFRSRRCASPPATATAGVSTSPAASAARTRSPTGRRCRARSRSCARPRPGR